MAARRPSSRSSGKGQVISKAWARVRSFWIAPTLVLVLALICRIESPASSLRRSTSLILRIGILFAAMTLIREVLRLRLEAGLRSEEHTSELQSRPHLVCRLLLEKKKKKKQLLS